MNNQCSVNTCYLQMRLSADSSSSNYTRKQSSATTTETIAEEGSEGSSLRGQMGNMNGVTTNGHGCTLME